MTTVYKSGTSVTPSHPPAARQSYAQWVRQAIRTVRSSSKDATTLFDSSVPEPIDLLRETVAGTFMPELSRDYVSAFGGGNPFVMEMLAARYGVDREQVLGTTGATGALSLLYRSLTKPGDHVLVETPGFDLFHDLAQQEGLQVGYFERQTDRFAIDPDAVAAALQPNTRLIVLSNLHNPSGMPVAHEALQRLAMVAEARGVLVVVDEVYGDYADPSVRPCPASSLSPNFISISSLTKMFGLGTLRCGWVVAAPTVMAPVRRMSEMFEFGVSTLSHAVGATVIRHIDRFNAYADDVLVRSRPMIEGWAAEMQAEGLIAGALPDAGCIYFPKLLGIKNSEAFSETLLAATGVVVAPGEYFGAPGHIRIGFAQKIANLERGLAALGDGLHRYRDHDLRT